MNSKLVEAAIIDEGKRRELHRAVTEKWNSWSWQYFEIHIGRSESDAQFFKERYVGQFEVVLIKHRQVRVLISMCRCNQAQVSI